MQSSKQNTAETKLLASMSQGKLVREIRVGLAETFKYFFSHHRQEDYWKCYRISINKHEIHLCSRCLGIYLGIIIGTVAQSFNSINQQTNYFLITVFPIFSLIDWFSTKFKATEVPTGPGA